MSTFASTAAFIAVYPFASQADALAAANGRNVIAACATNLYGMPVRYGFRTEPRALTAKGKPVIKGEKKMNGPVPGATKKLTLTDRAVMAFIKGADREAIAAELIAHGAKPESARCTAHFVVTGKVSKAHAEMIAAKKWIGFKAR